MNNIISVENARIAFRNFSGKEGRFNPAGRRNFCLLLDNSTANSLLDEGWNVKYLKPRDEADDPKPYIQVSVSFENFPPKIVLISGGEKQTLDEKSVDMLDWVDISNVDLSLRPYKWEVSGKTGIKGYLKSMYITIAEDEFEKKYTNLPDSANKKFDAYPDDDHGVPDQPW